MPEADTRKSGRYYLTPEQKAALTQAASKMALSDVQFVRRAIGEAVAKAGVVWPDNFRDERRRQESDR